MSKIENPKNFNAGNKMMSNNHVPSADQKIKKMDMGDAAKTASSNASKVGEGLEDKKKGLDLKNMGLDEAKREVKKQALSIAAAAATKGKVSKETAHKVLDTKLGTMAVDSIRSPGEIYSDNINKRRRERAASGQDPNSTMVYIEAMPLMAKVVLIFGFCSIFGVILFVSVSVYYFKTGNLKTQQALAEMTSSVVVQNTSVGNGPESSSSVGTGIFDTILEKFKRRFPSDLINLYTKIGKVFDTSYSCSGDNCNKNAEQRYFQKIADISYRYKNLYDVKLDWPLIIATNQIHTDDTLLSFERNLNDYNEDDILDLDKVTNLDWEYDYENIPEYDYLAVNDYRYDLQILAKNMVKKTSVQECVSADEVLATKTVYDVLDTDLVSGNENYLTCTAGEYKLTNTYKLDYEKYDEFLLEYLEKKTYGEVSENGYDVGGHVNVPGANSLASSMINLAKTELNSWNGSDSTGKVNLKKKYLSLFNLSDGNPWCASFTSWLISNTSYDGKKIYPDIIKTRSSKSQSYAIYFKNSKDSNINFHYNTDCQKYSALGSRYTPKQGDLIFFDNNMTWDGSFDKLNGATSYINHVGIVERYQGGYVYTIEGNSSDNIRQRSYNVGNCRIVGYGSWY